MAHLVDLARAPELAMTVLIRSPLLPEKPRPRRGFSTSNREPQPARATNSSTRPVSTLTPGPIVDDTTSCLM